MRIWDVHPGYLNRQSLLGEHRELHGLVSVLVNGKKGYSQHPETLRWVGYGWALRQRHRELACEMSLRGYKDNSPVNTRSNKAVWPSIFIDEPHVQFKLLSEKYKNKEMGRIPLPRNEQELWSHHKYSVLARDMKKYQEIGHEVANKEVSFEALSKELIIIMRVPPSKGGIRNSLQHMWGYVSAIPNKNYRGNIESWSLKRLLGYTQENAIKSNEAYLVKSTALSDLMVWV